MSTPLLMPLSSPQTATGKLPAQMPRRLPMSFKSFPEQVASLNFPIPTTLLRTLQPISSCFTPPKVEHPTQA